MKNNTFRRCFRNLSEKLEAWRLWGFAFWLDWLLCMGCLRN